MTRAILVIFAFLGVAACQNGGIYGGGSDASYGSSSGY
jgi:hypothetical protein